MADVSDSQLLSAMSAQPSDVSDEQLLGQMGQPQSGNAPTSNPASPTSQPNTWQKYGAGIIRGYKNVAGSFVPVDAWIANKLGFPETANRLTSNLANFQAQAPAFNQQNGLPGQMGEMTGEIATTIPAFAAGDELLAPIAKYASSAVPAVTKAVNLAYTGNKLAKLAVLGSAGAVGGGVTSALTSGSSDQPIRQQMTQGAELGGALGAAAPAIADTAGGIVNRLTGGGVPQAKAVLGNLAVNKFQIPLRGSQISNSPFMHYLDSSIGKVPFSGMEAQNEAQRTAFSRAVASTFGENASSLTPEVMSAARSRIGSVFNRVANNTTIGPDATNAMAENFAKIESDAQQVMGANEYAPIKNQMNNILSKVSSDGKIDGATYQAITRKGAPLDSALNSKDPNIRQYAGQIRTALDDALQTSAAPEDISALKQARLQWKNMRTVQDLAAKAGIEGEISPALLLGAVKKSYKDMAYSGAGDIGSLAHIGQQFLKEPPSSGTGERLALYSMLGAGSEGLGNMLHDPNALLHAGSVLAGVSGISRLIGSGLKSRLYRDALLNSVSNEHGALNTAFGTAAPLNNLFSNARPYVLPAGVIGGKQFMLNGTPSAVTQ